MAAAIFVSGAGVGASAIDGILGRVVLGGLPDGDAETVDR
jgi:hypothetical protein